MEMMDSEDEDESLPGDDEEAEYEAAVMICVRRWN